MARVSVWDEPKGGRIVPPPTLPAVNLSDLDVEREAKEAAARVAERRVIRNGRDAWEAIAKTETLDAWLRIGAALYVGKLRAIRVTRSNSGWGAAYSKEFGRWMREFGFGNMPKQVKSWAILLHENARSIEAWRATLPERQRRRLVHPLSNVRRWRAATGQYQAVRSRDLKWDAQSAWARFVACAKAVPPDLARPLWQAAYTEAAAHR
jgi:hypothetical protein